MSAGQSWHNMRAIRLLLAIAVASALLTTGMALFTGGVARARGSSERTFNEEAHLKVAKATSTQLVARGQVTGGTFKGAITLNLTIASPFRSIAVFSSSSSSGSIAGRGIAKYLAEGSVSHFSGVGGFTHGTGRYAHISGNEVHITGAYDRRKGQITLRINGRMRL